MKPLTSNKITCGGLTSIIFDDKGLFGRQRTSAAKKNPRRIMMAVVKKYTTEKDRRLGGPFVRPQEYVLLKTLEDKEAAESLAYKPYILQAREINKPIWVLGPFSEDIAREKADEITKRAEEIRVEKKEEKELTNQKHRRMVLRCFNQQNETVYQVKINSS